MHRPALLLLLLVACGGGDTSSDATCGASAPCAGGEVCDLTSPGGAICVDATGDSDGDGLTNDKDLCLHVAGGQYDEDGDGLGDECDACPIARPPTTPETDGDGVDSPCDPSPTTAGDKIVLFQGFNGPLPLAWTKSAAWQITGGAAVVTATALEEIKAPVVSAGRVAVFADYRTDQAGAISAGVGVSAISMLPMGDVIVRCGGQRAGGNDLLQLLSSSSNDKAASADLFEANRLYGLLAQVDGGNASCAYHSATYNDALNGNTGGDAINRVGLYAQGATIRFAYILAVGR